MAHTFTKAALQLQRNIITGTNVIFQPLLEDERIPVNGQKEIVKVILFLFNKPWFGFSSWYTNFRIYLLLYFVYKTWIKFI